MSGYDETWRLPPRLRYERAAGPRPRDRVSERAQQHWDVRDERGGVGMRVEIFEGSVQWGVRVFDTLPGVDVSDLVRVVAHLLVWHAHCPTDTVDAVFARTHERHTLVRVSGDFV